MRDRHRSKPKPWPARLKAWLLWTFIPRFRYWPEDYQNLARWGFEWWFINIWSNWSVGLTFEINLSTESLTVFLSIPYVSCRLWLLKFPKVFSKLDKRQPACFSMSETVYNLKKKGLWDQP